ncbi:YafY family transcriptional regulator [Sphingopyxis sp. DHUNG17]|uniref:helix-turn-helix transcriptional regulator n=1 Tax=Sphingopyxis jiangsuensis TaxID=2871171 RepID=UPI00191CEE4F|nr:YafY family protein [Sphingopyxis lutea]MBL0767579.1 YafY family transcriptional regulator [Sphingopyxis lutea]
MRRTERLFGIIQALRTARRPVAGHELAAQFEVSLRTLYRDMAELLAQRVPVRGEAGTGYVIDSEYDMPPLMLTVDELEAAALGAAWVAQRGDDALARGARNLVAKLSAAVPDHLRTAIIEPAIAPLAFRKHVLDGAEVSIIRTAIRDRRKIGVSYVDVEGRATERILWPIIIGYQDDIRIVAAHCELRDAFRHFRTDRMKRVERLDARIPEPFARLRGRWEIQQLRRRDCT